MSNYFDRLFPFFRKPVSDVAYRVQRKDGGDVEHLVPPTRAHLESSLATAGKTLHSRAEPTASEEVCISVD